jgi:enoyl-CoA hydratase/carnithine racemase
MVTTSQPADVLGHVRDSDRDTTTGIPVLPFLALELDGPVPADVLAAVATAARTNVIIGVLRGQWPQDELLSNLTVTLAETPNVPRTAVAVADSGGALELIGRRIGHCPSAAVVVDGLLRVTENLSVADGLVAESLAYSMLLGGPEFAHWRAENPVRPRLTFDGPAVAMTRQADELDIVLDRPSRRNSFTAEMRDALVEALTLPTLDRTITRVRLRGNGPSFSSGGDLDEFGAATDLVAAYFIRLERSAGWAVHRIADRVEAYLHGACIGAGIEIPAFAERVVATRDAWFKLPELQLGLVPGAGGTVSVTRRIGRWRTAWMVLSGEAVHAVTAHRWGLVDSLAAVDKIS